MSTTLHAPSSYTGLSIAKQLTAVLRDPVAAYTAYAARVTADGGSVSDAAACQAAFTAAYKGGYWWQARMAFSGRWGVRTQDGYVTKIYNLFDSTLDAYMRGEVDLDNSLGYNVPLFNSAGDFMFARGVSLNKNNRFGYVTSSHRPSVSVGPALTYKPVSELWSIGGYDGGSLTVNGANLQSPGAEYATPSDVAVGYLVDQTNDRIDVWLDGVLKKRNHKSWTKLATGVKADMQWTRNSAGSVYPNEFWYFDDATFDGIQQCCLDVGNRY